MTAAAPVPADESAQLAIIGRTLFTMGAENPAALREYLASLTEAERAKHAEAIAYRTRELDMGVEAAAEWRATPATMANHLTGGRYRLWPYTRLLGEKYRDAVEGRSTRQIWALPARYGKSQTASRWGPAWALDRDPSHKIILVSYGDNLAVENAIAVRDIMREHSDVLRATLQRDRQRQDRFVTTEGGGVLAAGVMSAITGFGAHGVCFDDPFKDWQEAHSQARRDLVDNQFRAVVSLRLETEAAWVIIVATRWHENDLSGRLLARMQDGTGEQWEMIRLPAVAEAYDPNSPDPLLRIPDPLGRKPGEVLEPERFSPAAVAARHLALGSYLTAGLEQQRPAPEEGGELKRSWWRLDDNVPADADEWLISADMKLKEKETGDFVVVQTWARTGSSFWLTAQLRGQWNQPTTECAIALASVRQSRCRTAVVENTGNGPEVMQSLREPMADYVVSDEVAGLLGMTEEERAAVQRLRRRGMTALVPENVKGSKVVRARAVSGLIEAGNVHLWARAPWLGTFLDEASSFPNGAHDDQVDAMSQALKRLRGSQVSVRIPDRPVVKPPIIRRGPSSSRVVMPSRLR